MDILNHSDLHQEKGLCAGFYPELIRVLNELSIYLSQLRGSEALIRRPAPYDRDDTSYFLREEYDLRGFTPLWPHAYEHLNIALSLTPSTTKATAAEIDHELEIRINKLRSFGIWLASLPQPAIYHTLDTQRFYSFCDLAAAQAPSALSSVVFRSSQSLGFTTGQTLPSGLLSLPEDAFDEGIEDEEILFTAPGAGLSIESPYSSSNSFNIEPPHSPFGPGLLSPVCVSFNQSPGHKTATLTKEDHDGDEEEEDGEAEGGWFQNGHHLANWMETFSS